MELEKAQNELESFIFDTQDKLTQEDYEKCSTSEERENMQQKLSEASDWLYEQMDAKKSVSHHPYGLTFRIQVLRFFLQENVLKRAT